MRTQRVELSQTAATAIERLRHCASLFGIDRVLVLMDALRAAAPTEDEPIYRSLVELLQEIQQMDNSMVPDPDYDGPKSVDYGGGVTDPAVRAAQDGDR